MFICRDYCKFGATGYYMFGYNEVSHFKCMWSLIIQENDES